MSVSMMDVRIVSMAVTKGWVDVPMRMGCLRFLSRHMLVLMMLIVIVPVLVFEMRVSMLVAMHFGHVQ